jgi:cell shape-determining protein MreC
MNYAPRNNTSPHFQSSRTKSGLSLPVRIVAGLIVLLGILYIFLPGVMPAIFLSFVHPLWKAEADMRLGNTTMDELRKTYADMMANEAINNAVFKENDDLKTMLGRTKVEKPLLATILKKPPFTAYDSFILDVGTSEGVQVGNTVYALGNVPIGTIAEVIGNTSRVKLFSSSGEKFDILIGPSSIEATAEGKGGGYFEVSLPRDTKIKVGDQVLIPSIDSSYAATVDGIASEPSEPFAKVLFHQPVNMYEQRFVIVNTHVT